MLIALFMLALLAKASEATATVKRTACDSEIYCDGPLLRAVQEMELFPDSKTFVDMSMKTQPGVVLEAYRNLTLATAAAPSRADLRNFVEQYFDGPNTEFETWIPEDWKENPALLNKISDPNFKHWANELHGFWKVLGKKIKEDVKTYQDRYSMLYLPNPFIIPGERFREFYYWDSYWIVNGLLLSGMTNTARGMIENFLSIVDRYGIVPNGGRIYYTRRSQPPFLTPIVESYYRATGDIDFVRSSLPLLEKEYSFWSRERMVTVEKDGVEYQMARYNVKLDTPRPEGFREDVELTHGKPAEEASRMFGDLASACESGWDFSSRWFADHGAKKFQLSSVRTSQILPVDLNAIVWWNEKLLADFHSALGNTEKAATFRRLANQRAEAIHKLLWNSELGAWFDYDLESGQQRKYFYPSNIVPLFVGCYGNGDASSALEIEEKVLVYLKTEGVLDFPGGVPTSHLTTGQQWDSINSWAPLVHMMVNGLAATSSPHAHQVAQELAHKWLMNNWHAWQSSGHMFEKYKADSRGEAGSGGEYTVQIGFGWTNGVVLMLLNKYGHVLSSGTELPSAGRLHYYSDIFTVLISSCSACCLIVYTSSFMHRAKSAKDSTRNTNTLFRLRWTDSTKTKESQSSDRTGMRTSWFKRRTLSCKG